MPNLPETTDIGSARRDAAIAALGLTGRDLVSATITPFELTCQYLIRDDKGVAKKVGIGYATRTVVHKFVNL